MLGNATVEHIAVTSTKDKYGDTTTTKAAPVAVPGAIFAPRTSSERTDPTAPAVIVGGTLYVKGITPSPLDQFTVDGVLYDVQGEPGHWVSPFTREDFGYEVAVKRYEQP
ncbi:MAG TPA: hypothetical protein VFK56_10845 [Mycobacterium sp.]|nr:hypothetical protein [Mycobacterium sp.]